MTKLVMHLRFVTLENGDLGTKRYLMRVKDIQDMLKLTRAQIRDYIDLGALIDD